MKVSTVDNLLKSQTSTASPAEPGGLLLVASQIGKSAVKHFATAAIEREQSSDISKVLEHCAKGVLTIVSNLPNSFISDVKNMRGDADVKTLRRLMWPLIRTPATGIPRATLAARTSWLTELKKNLHEWLTLVEQETTFRREPTWNNRVVGLVRRCKRCLIDGSVEHQAACYGCRE